jgi:hypothetical protein
MSVPIFSVDTDRAVSESRVRTRLTLDVPISDHADLAGVEGGQ